MLNRRAAFFLLSGILASAPLLVAWQQATAPPPPPPPTTQAVAPAAAVVFAKPVAGKYLAENAIDLRALLPDPPAAGSPAALGEIELIRAIQADAAPATVSRALAENEMTVWLFAEVLGRDFTAEKKPKTTAFIRQIDFDAKGVASSSKKIWSRPRPSDQSTEIKMLIERPTSDSFPSGHTTRGALWAEALVLVVPEKAEAIRARARLIGLDRIVLGVHFPSDVAAGNALGKAIVDEMKKNPAFQQELEEARSEWVK